VSLYGLLAAAWWSEPVWLARGIMQRYQVMIYDAKGDGVDLGIYGIIIPVTFAYGGCFFLF
jgi:hypothetical protein